MVAATLAGAFEHHGHHVVIATFKAPDKLTVARTDPRVKIYTLGDYKCSSKSVSSLRNILCSASNSGGYQPVGTAFGAL